MAAINAAYTREHKKTLKAALESELSGNLKHYLTGLVEARDESPSVNMDAVRADAERLYNAGEGKIGTDEKTFIEIFTKRSYLHLREVLNAYETIHKHHTMHQAVDGEFSGHIKRALLGIVTFLRNPGEFYADNLMRSMKGLGTDDSRLIHNVVSQRQNMGPIKLAFSMKYGKSLYEWVKSDTSGDYKTVLLELIGN